MYTRTPTAALTHLDVRDLIEAEHLARALGRPLDGTITVHMGLLHRQPPDTGRWVSGFLNKLRIWCARRGGYYAIWVRENYEGTRREHLHVVLYLKEQHRSDLENAVARWLPGRDGVVQVGRTTYRSDRYGRRTSKSLTYLLKQMTPQAWFALNKRVRREKHNRHDGALVAPVLGLRCGTSRSLNAKAQSAAWEVRRVDLNRCLDKPASDRAA